KPRESAAEAAARRRAEAEARNARYRRTRELRATLERLEADARETDAELADVTAQLSDPTVYQDAGRVRELIERHNSACDRAEALAAEWTAVSAELEAHERVAAQAGPVGAGRR
ncbi:MAG TPA: hypothetical protein VFH63_00075, partial [candidate division Zixibacteria bacterium]|nr:hypothetical protein [candidate division Zixibacteria bacterium]